MKPETLKLLETHYRHILEFPTWSVDTKVGYIVAAGNIDPRLTGDIGRLTLDDAYTQVRAFVVNYLHAHV